LDAIRRFHVEERGWDDIGYHFVIEFSGDEMCLFRGRDVRYRGAHCEAGGRNWNTLGVCVVGRFETPESVTPPVFTRVRDALAMLVQAYHLDPRAVRGHREWDPAKTCPGMGWDMDAVRVAIASTLGYAENLDDVHVRPCWPLYPRLAI
jgi:hypothetical protein